MEKTGKSWQTDQTECMAANVDRKFACEGRPDPVDGTRNYISGVQLGDHALGASDEYVTESKGQFAHPGKPERAVSYSSTIGKALREHSWDFAMGRQKTTTQWIPAQSAEMARKAAEKYDCMTPALDPELGKELRASHVFLGGDAVEWPDPQLRRSLSMPGRAPIGSVACQRAELRRRYNM